MLPSTPPSNDYLGRQRASSKTH